MSVVTPTDLWKALHTLKNFCRQTRYCDDCPLLVYRNNKRKCRLTLIQNDGDLNEDPSTWELNTTSPAEYNLFTK